MIALSELLTAQSEVVDLILQLSFIFQLEILLLYKYSTFYAGIILCPMLLGTYYAQKYANRNTFTLHISLTVAMTQKLLINKVKIY